MYIVYIHTCPNGKKYVGMTKQKPNNRWRSGKAYIHCSGFYSAILEYGWENISHDIVEAGLSKEEAESKERMLIAKFRTTDKRCGYNCFSGGLSGSIASDDLKLRMSESRSGERNPRFGTHMSEETKSKISASKRGKPLSEGCKRKLSDALGKERNPASRPVLQYDKKMNFIKRWPYIRAAEEATGANNISTCCRGKLKTSGGYIWRYAEMEVGGA